MPKEQRLKLSTLLAFASPALALSALGLPIVVYLPPFYAEDVGLGLSAVGTVFMITRFWDVITDPVLGTFSDRVRTRFGRRRPFLVASVPILLVCVWMVFMPGENVSAGYLLGWMVALYVGWTLSTLSHMSWGAELSTDYHERSRVQGVREMFLTAGMVLVLALPAIIERTTSHTTGADRVASMGWFILILLPITVTIAVWRVPERPAPEAATIGFRRALRILAGNRPLRRVLVADVFAGASAGIAGSLFMFFAKHALKLGNAASLLLLIYFLAGCFAIPLWVKISYRIGKHRAMAAAGVWNVVWLAGLAVLPPGQLWVALGGFVLVGFAAAVPAFLMRAMMADVCDVDEVETGTPRTGLYFSLLTLTNKVGLALAVGITYPILDIIGFDPKADVNTASSIDGLRWLFVLASAAMNLALAATMWTFPLDLERQRELRARIEQRSLETAAEAGTAE